MNNYDRIAKAMSEIERIENMLNKYQFKIAPEKVIVELEKVYDILDGDI